MILKPRKKPKLISEDMEMTMKCARLMGLQISPFRGKDRQPRVMVHGVSGMGHPTAYEYNPLVNKAQAFELVEKLYLDIARAYDLRKYAVSLRLAVGVNVDLRRAIVVCCSRISK